MKYPMTGGVEYATWDDYRLRRDGMPQQEPVVLTSDEVADFMLADGVPDAPEPEVGDDA